MLFGHTHNQYKILDPIHTQKKMIKEEEEEAFERKQGLKKIKKLSNSVNSFLCLISKLNTFKKI